MRDVYIIGTGIHPWMGFAEQVFAEFAAVAVDEALKDANIEWQKIQSIMAGIFIYGGNAGHLSGQYLESIFGETGVPVVNVYNACATGSAAIRMAYNSVAAGETDTSLAFGADVSPKGFLTAKSDNAVQDRGCKDRACRGRASASEIGLRHRHGDRERPVAQHCRRPSTGQGVRCC